MITGASQLLVHLGDPIAHARAPLLMNPVLDRRRAGALLVPMHVAADHLKEAVGGLRATQNLRGGIITMPHKVAFALLADELTPEAREIGACNVFRRDSNGRLIGSMLDGEGFVAGLDGAGIGIRDKTVFMSGAGGVALGIAFALAKYGARHISLYNRTSDRAERLRKRLSAAFPLVSVTVCSLPDPSGCDIAINATALGMQAGDDLPMLVDRLGRDTVAAEVVIKDVPTAFLSAASERGCQTQPGLKMLEAQIELMADFILDA